jgi:hypothetical protein
MHAPADLLLPFFFILVRGVACCKYYLLLPFFFILGVVVAVVGEW